MQQVKCPASNPATCKIQDYGIIGDSRTAALVSREGSIDWLCWPRFDSPSLFAALLDPQVGGCWRIHVLQSRRTERWYTEHTNILVTRFHCVCGTAVLSDLMPVRSEGQRRQAAIPDHEILRQVECTDGEVEIEIEFGPRADYGRKRVRMREAGKLGLQADLGRGELWLRGSVPLELREDTGYARLSLRAGTTLQFSLTYAEDAPAVLPSLGRRIPEAIERTAEWWQRWAKRAEYVGPYREAVIRSALVLKLLTYAPSGAIVAAPTTSLPERVGDSWNWDYRFCWLRDASLAMRALLGLGYRDEADAFLGWLLETTSLTRPVFRVMYTVYGDAPPAERELEHLRGYMGSCPVRVGNRARGQLQLDVYGEVVDAAAQYVYHGGRIDRDTQRVLAGIGNYVVQNWRQPDEGIWELRSGREHHTHSRALCWTALERLLSLNDKGLLKGVPREQFASAGAKIEQELRARAWNARLHSYVSVLGGESVDASLLQLPWYGFESADSERMRETYQRICKHLRVGKNLLYRYRREPPEGAFGICSFWEVEYLALGGGTVGEARHLFEGLLAYANDLGLFAEEIDPQSGTALGNFPQAYMHVGLISAALAIEEREHGKARLHHRREGGTQSARERLRL
jgi:GH15 family glucan-1,4-alpha-glucosidase